VAGSIVGFSPKARRVTIRKPRKEDADENTCIDENTSKESRTHRALIRGSNLAKPLDEGASISRTPDCKGIVCFGCAR
jgi:hypothetical protein